LDVDIIIGDVHAVIGSSDGLIDASIPEVLLSFAIVPSGDASATLLLEDTSTTIYGAVTN